MKVLSVVGNRPQFIKSGPLSVALREAGIDEVVLHTGQHYDRELSEVFFEELGLAEPAYRLEAHTRDVDGDAARHRLGDRAPNSPTAVVVFGDTNSTVAGARAARETGVPLAHVEAGMRSGDLTMPEEHNRIEVDGDRGPSPLPGRALARDPRGGRRARADRGRRRRDGGCEPSVRTRCAPALRRPRAARSRAGDLRRRDDPPGRERGRPSPGADPRRAAAHRIARRLSRPSPNPRCNYDTGTVPRTGPVGLAAFVPGLHGARVAGARDRDRLGRRAEGGVLVRRPVRDGAPVDGVGRHGRARREHARRRRSRATRRSRRSRRFRCHRTAPCCTETAMQRIGSQRRSVRFSADDRAKHRRAGRRAGNARRGTSPSSAPATSACRSRSCSPAPGSPSSSSTSPRRSSPRSTAARATSRTSPSETLRPFVEDGRISATTDYDRLRDADAIVVCLPTPLSKQREPDITILRNAVSAIAARLRPGHLVVLESTTYPGTTREIVLPLLETSGLEVGKDFNLAFSPERVDPGNTKWRPENVPKIVGGITDACTERAAALYQGAHRPGAPGVVARGGRADEAAREHLPLGQHRARQRARAALRPDGHRRLGGRRRGLDEAVRLHALRARPGPRRPLHPDRPLLPHVEGAGVRLLHGVHRARRAR